MTEHDEQTQSRIPIISEWVFTQGDDLKTDSRIVAKVFGKRHDNVVRDIHNLECSSNFLALNFELVNETMTYVDGNGVEQTKETSRTAYYEMTKDGFMILVMGYTGSEAMRIKERYIEAFNTIQRLLTDHHYDLIDQLNKALLAEKVSFTVGSLAGKALNRRRGEKRQYQTDIARIRNMMQPNLFAGVCLE